MNLSDGLYDIDDMLMGRVYDSKTGLCHVFLTIDQEKVERRTRKAGVPSGTAVPSGGSIGGKRRQLLPLEELQQALAG